ncbi:winged helix-turn-helix domain-containing protein [Streptomyces sp. BH-SS-21]|uniref:Winged helix-turn-helix domain-containing protein n=1 Tax=Streptomyces liliiviolaceus TaxID=2823109 RepID=A0A940Y0A2_9ACTN|nr:BTAD domain-containing putative transcriptional regulator [Streptomyces liliiviolaceus]MBQ0850476.1 winged helix-turn-helix domain-containing protein [Streptomyces liliiviolaceus]
MEIRILGPVEVATKGKFVPLGGSKPKTILATLILADGKAIANTEITEALWGSAPPATRQAQIHTYVSRLRKALDPHARIVRRAASYLLTTDSVKVDYKEFIRLADKGREKLLKGRYAEASGFYSQALAQWRGPALDGVTQNLSDLELPRIDELRTAAIEEKAEADLGLGRHGQLVAELTSLVEAFPVRERLRALLMTALYRSGRQADALDVYHAGRTTLAETLGVDPSASLKAVFHSILNGDPALDLPHARLEAVPRRHVDVPSMLPPSIADFTGRETQMRELSERLRPTSTPQPLVISGMAGAGKSVLAVRLAHEKADSFPDGQLYARLSCGEHSPRKVHDVLGEFIRAVDPEETVPESAVERAWLYRSILSNRKILILLDDMLDEKQIEMLLPGVGESRVIVTGQGYLDTLVGAHVTQIREFEHGEAVALVRRIVGDKRVNREPGAVDALVELCDCLPLAVRTAATRLAGKPHWSIAHLVQRMTDTSRNRLDELRLANLDVRESLFRSFNRLPHDMRGMLGRLTLLSSSRIVTESTANILDTTEVIAEDFLEFLVEQNLLRSRGTDDRGNMIYSSSSLVMMAAAEFSERLVS